jgi:hypothetical protein
MQTRIDDIPDRTGIAITIIIPRSTAAKNMSFSAIDMDCYD